jgi:hypothetical protein
MFADFHRKNRYKGVLYARTQFFRDLLKQDYPVEIRGDVPSPAIEQQASFPF